MAGQTEDRRPFPRRDDAPAPALSEAELRALLGDEDGGDEPDSPRGGRESGASLGGGAARGRVLLVSRDDDELRLLSGLLASLGLGVTVARNPFTALDQLRRRSFAGLVSDLSLWADRGKLLFQRLEEGRRPVPVVFICAPEESAEVRSAGAAAALRRPLDPGEVALAASLFTEDERPAGSAAAAEQMPAEPVNGAPAEEAPVAGAPVEGGRLPEPAAPPPRDAVELRWLRFFYEARRALRALPPGRARLERVLDVFARELGAPCGIGVAHDGGWWIAIRPGSADLGARLALALAGEQGGRRETNGAGAESGGGWLQAPWRAGDYPALFGALFPETDQPLPAGSFPASSFPASSLPEGATTTASRAGHLFGTFLDELTALLTETGPFDA